MAERIPEMDLELYAAMHPSGTMRRCHVSVDVTLEKREAGERPKHELRATFWAHEGELEKLIRILNLGSYPSGVQLNIIDGDSP